MRTYDGDEVDEYSLLGTPEDLKKIRYD